MSHQLATFTCTLLTLALVGCPSSVGTGGGGGQGGAAGGGGGLGGAGGAGNAGGMGGSAGGGNAGGNGGGNGGAAPACAPGDPADVTLAMNQVFLGDTDTSGVASATAWQGFGFDLDGVNTTNDLTGHCSPAAGAPASALSDGPGGIDNSFGKRIIPLLNAFAPDISATVTAQIQIGAFTLLFRLEGLGASPSGDPLVTRVWQGVALPLSPSFDGSDCWPAAPEQLATPGDLASTVMSFEATSVANNLVDSGPTDVTVFLTLDGFGAPVSLSVLHAHLSFQLDPDHLGAVNGKLGGVMDREAFVEQIRDLAGAFDPSLCAGATIDSIVAQIRQAADLMTTGSQAANVECDAISVGLGFTLEAVTLDGIGPQAPAAPNPCP